MARGRRSGAVLRLLVAVLAGTALVAACGPPTPGPAQPAPPPTPAQTPPPPPTLTPEEQALAWTTSVCDALLPVTVDLTNPPGLDVGAPEATRQAFSAYLAEGLVVTDRARADLSAAGPAPVPGGDAVAEQVLGDVADLRADLVAAKAQIDQADPADPIALGRTLIGIGRVVGALLDGAEVVSTLSGVPALRAAYLQSPSCEQLQRAGRAGSPGPTPPPPPTG